MSETLREIMNKAIEKAMLTKFERDEKRLITRQIVKALVFALNEVTNGQYLIYDETKTINESNKSIRFKFKDNYRFDAFFKVKLSANGCSKYVLKSIEISDEIGMRNLDKTIEEIHSEIIEYKRKELQGHAAGLQKAKDILKSKLTKALSQIEEEISISSDIYTIQYDIRTYEAALAAAMKLVQEQEDDE